MKLLAPDSIIHTQKIKVIGGEKLLHATFNVRQPWIRGTYHYEVVHLKSDTGIVVLQDMFFVGE